MWYHCCQLAYLKRRGSFTNSVQNLMVECTVLKGKIAFATPGAVVSAREINPVAVL